MDGKEEEGSVLFLSLERDKMQTENFGAPALYFFIFRAECSLVISLFSKDFYPVGVWFLLYDYFPADYFLKKFLCVENKTYICYES